MNLSNRYLRKIYLSVLTLTLFSVGSVVEAAPCTGNDWQPTFVHDLDNPDGPWYVTPNGQFEKLRIVNNLDWTPHACDLINRSGVRDRRGYSNCQQYTRVQCGCGRGLSEGNATCATFLARHNNAQPVLPYVTYTTREADVIRHQSPVMRKNKCTCEDWNNDGAYGVVLGRRVLRSNYGTYAQCMSFAGTLKECLEPDVIRNTDTVMGGGIEARIIDMEECRYSSGGRPRENSHYNCKVKYSLRNTTNAHISMTSAWYEKQDMHGKKTRGGLNYMHLGSGEKKTGFPINCTIPHGRNRGSLTLGGTGYHDQVKPTPNKEQFSWRLQVSCSK